MLPSYWNGTFLDEDKHWSNNTATFMQWWRDWGYHGMEPVMQESSVIKNYGTEILKKKKCIYIYI
jgi:hypothetical protein